MRRGRRDRQLRDLVFGEGLGLAVFRSFLYVSASASSIWTGSVRGSCGVRLVAGWIERLPVVSVSSQTEEPRRGLPDPIPRGLGMIPLAAARAATARNRAAITPIAIRVLRRVARRCLSESSFRRAICRVGVTRGAASSGSRPWITDRRAARLTRTDCCISPLYSDPIEAFRSAVTAAALRNPCPAA